MSNLKINLKALSYHTWGNLCHSDSLCPQLPFSPAPQPNICVPLSITDIKVELFNNVPICNNFNENICTYPSCFFLHICSACKDVHPPSVCPPLAHSCQPSSPPSGDCQKHPKSESIHSNTCPSSGIRTVISSRLWALVS